MKFLALVYLMLGAAAAQAAEKSSERVSVTGSRIKQIDAEKATPLEVIDATEIENSGGQSVGDVLQKLSANSFGSRRETYGGGTSDAADINLRGAGSARTLVLLNGRRISPDPQSGAVDLNMIPKAAIEKVEVLKAGASAIYGSDALGGVVNIILKKDFVGMGLGSQGYFPAAKSGGGGSNHYLISGAQNEKYSFLTLVQYRRSHALYQRDFFRDRRDNGGIPASYRGLDKSDGKDSAWQTSGCNPELLDVKGPNQKCLTWKDREKTRTPDVDQLSMLTSVTYQLARDVEMFAETYASHKHTFWYWFPTYDQRNFTVPTDSVKSRLPQDANIGDAKNVEIFTSMFELGRDERRIDSENMGLQTGLRGDIDRYHWEFGASHDSTNRMQKASNQAYLDKVEKSIQTGAFDPFAPEGQRVKDPSFYESRADAYLEQKSLTNFYDLTVSGPAAFGVEVAAGANAAHYQYRETQDQGLKSRNVWGTMGGSEGHGERDVNSLFVEGMVPFGKTFDFTLAYRLDQYSDYGKSNTPAASLRYSPMSWLALRASGTKGFKAPTLYEMHRSPTLQYISPFKDAVTGNANSMYIVQSGNTDIKEETSTSYNLGVILAPTDRMSFSIDYWNLVINDVIGYPDIKTITEVEAAGGRVSDYGVTVHRDPLSNEITLVESTYMNIGKQRSQGIDLGIKYGEKIGIANVGFSSTHSIMKRYEESGFPTIAPTDRIGTAGRPKVRNSTKLGLGVDKTYSSLGMLYIGPQKNSPFDQRAEYKQYDLTINQELMTQTKASLGIVNLTDTKPSTDDHTLYQLAGRTYWLGLEQVF